MSKKKHHHRPKQRPHPAPPKPAAPPATTPPLAPAASASPAPSATAPASSPSDSSPDATQDAEQTGAPSAPAATASAASFRSAAFAKGVPRSHRELAKAIFAQCDPVAVGRELLESGGNDRGGSVKARVWETLVEFLLGKPAPAEKKEAPLQIIWDIPGPPRNMVDP